MTFYIGFSTIFVPDDAFAALNMDPEDFGNKTQHRIETELMTSELVDGEYVESWVCSDLDVANLLKRGNYCTAIAQKPGKATITATTNKGRYGSAEITVERFDSFAIDAAHFPDDGFRSFLLQRYQYMILGDNLIWPELLQDEVTLNNLTGFKSLKGIEYFTGLKELYCSYFEGTSVDLSGNTNLEILSMPFSNALQSVNLSGCTALEAVSFYECGLSSLDVSHCHDLYVLNCNYNELTRLDVSGCRSFACWMSETTG